MEKVVAMQRFFASPNCEIVGVIVLDKNVDAGRQYKFSDNEMQLTTFIENAKELVDYAKKQD